MTGEAALIFFYAVFWSAATASVARYQPFPTHLWFSSRRGPASARFGVAFVLINACPVGVLLYLLWRFPDPTGAAGLRPGEVVGAAVASLSVFGWVRMYHAFTATGRARNWFYTQAEQRRFPTCESEPNTFAPHFVPGLAFLAVYTELGTRIAAM